MERGIRYFVEGVGLRLVVREKEVFVDVDVKVFKIFIKESEKES